MNFENLGLILESLTSLARKFTNFDRKVFLKKIRILQSQKIR